MKKNLLVIGFLGLTLIRPGSPAEAGRTSARELEQINHRFPFTIMVAGGGEKPDLFIYANVNQNIHIYRLETGQLKLEWQTSNLGSPVTSLLVRDLYKDGQPELVFCTRVGRPNRPFSAT